MVANSSAAKLATGGACAEADDRDDAAARLLRDDRLPGLFANTLSFDTVARTCGECQKPTSCLKKALVSVWCVAKKIFIF